jgi:hypothetical protein
MRQSAELLHEVLELGLIERGFSDELDDDFGLGHLVLREVGFANLATPD